MDQRSDPIRGYNTNTNQNDDDTALNRNIDSVSTSDIDDDTTSTAAVTGTSDTGTTDAASVAPNEEAVVIVAEIEQTRTELSDTLNAIQAKLSPDSIKEQAKTVVGDAVHGATENVKDTVYDATVGKAERMVRRATYRANRAQTSFLDTVKQNPIPTALAGLGLSWLVMNYRSGGNEESSYRYADYDYTRGRYDDRDYGRGRESYDYRSRRYYDDRDDEGGKLNQAKEKVGEVASEAKERVNEFADEAQYRMSRMANRAQERASDVTDVAQERAGDIVGMIRANPVPAALIGLGIGWLLTNRGQSSSGRSYSGRSNYYGSEYYDEDQYGHRPDWGRDRESPPDRSFERAGYRSNWDRGSNYNEGSSGGTGGGVGGAVSNVKSTVGDAASAATERVSNVASTATDKVGDVASAANERISDFGNEAQYQALKMRYRAQEMSNERPLMMGAMAFALGAAVGMALPETEQERRFMGETRERVVERVQEVAQDTMQKVQDVASEAKDAATDVVKNQTSDDA